MLACWYVLVAIRSPTRINAPHRSTWEKIIWVVKGIRWQSKKRLNIVNLPRQYIGWYKPRLISRKFAQHRNVEPFTGSIFLNKVESLKMILYLCFVVRYISIKCLISKLSISNQSPSFSSISLGRQKA